ncbi:MAG TPA: peptidylprolyl isomerase [Cyanobacteria bacterium UBA11149]|nr:peptidylprolyl isomerase [Cyanobacteria bacterium UBA11367]HBE60873.1 peptidylprolyl isomerase [Cyanobacteria bacterium UBA11366]HBK65386.1 peptidylprolyl isomerase [Cyanobacteria bacterium UBA11166]HBR74885.1 peptidylprolyl isomerase [Cyanobacteria bacterium UBA11159]HBS67972.1 peptidylprolyl isomerase [Cyanobacteria bacterium UBA11153]HBW92099.1 peptidylprolyl isomerase [Cyanobacteria bacterium UBA11149]HCA96467.1 peptidylprolyl isomerase [Cyanobacteria bacterium UBA9226]
MNSVLQVGDRTIAAEELIPLLAKYQLLPQLLREIIVDGAITAIDCTPEEKTLACQQFYERNQLMTEADRLAWLERQNMTNEQVEELVDRGIKIEKFKQLNWANKIDSYFLKRKEMLDRAIYSLLRTKDGAMAQELYFRIQEGEQSFSDLAKEYSQGPEVQTGGLIGPVQLNFPHPMLAQMLRVSQPGQLWPPTRLGEWFIIVRLEKFFPAQLDDQMRRQLTDELFNSWVQEQVKQTKIS